MIVSLKHNFVFMKVNKTATSSIELILSENIEDSAIVTPINPGGKLLYAGRNVPIINGKPVFQNHESFGQIKHILGSSNILNLPFVCNGVMYGVDLIFAGLISVSILPKNSHSNSLAN